MNYFLLHSQLSKNYLFFHNYGTIHSTSPYHTHWYSTKNPITKTNSHSHKSILILFFHFFILWQLLDHSKHLSKNQKQWINSLLTHTQLVSYHSFILVLNHHLQRQNFQKMHLKFVLHGSFQLNSKNSKNERDWNQEFSHESFHFLCTKKRHFDHS